jgi:hypothetical protein
MDIVNNKIKTKWKHSITRLVIEFETILVSIFENRKKSLIIKSFSFKIMVNYVKYPSTRSLYYYYMIPLRWYRRQLHRLEPERDDVRRRYSGIISLKLRRGTLIKHVKYGFCYVSDNFKNRFSLHNFKTRRITQHARRQFRFRVLTGIAFRTQFFSLLKSMSLG